MQRSLFAIIVSAIGIILLLKINSNIAAIYSVSGQKTRALFYLVEFGFLYKYYVAAFGITAIILSFNAYRNNEERKWMIAAAILSIFAFIATFVKLWKWMVWMY